MARVRAMLDEWHGINPSDRVYIDDPDDDPAVLPEPVAAPVPDGPDGPFIPSVIIDTSGWPDDRTG